MKFKDTAKKGKEKCSLEVQEVLCVHGMMCVYVDTPKRMC